MVFGLLSRLLVEPCMSICLKVVPNLIKLLRGNLLGGKEMVPMGAIVAPKNAGQSLGAKVRARLGA